MNCFDLKQMSYFSGVSEQMITLWNKKYQIFHDEKITEESKFNAKELKKLQNVAMLTNLNAKHKIADICQLSGEELSIRLEFELQTYLKNETDYENIIGLLIIFLSTFDGPNFENILSLVIRQLGIEKTYSEIIRPILQRIGIASDKPLTTSLARQRFAISLLRKFFYFLIKNTARPVPNERLWLLFLNENNHQDLELLYSCLVLKKHGESIIFLGENTSLSVLEECSQSVKPTHFLTFINPQTADNELTDYAQWISTTFPSAQFIAAGSKKSFAHIEIDSLCELTHPEELNHYLEQL